MAVEYERYINRSGANEIMNRWEEKNGVTFTAKEDMDIDSFKEAVEGVDQWFVEELLPDVLHARLPSQTPVCDVPAIHQTWNK